MALLFFGMALKAYIESVRMVSPASEHIRKTVENGTANAPDADRQCPLKAAITAVETASSKMTTGRQTQAMDGTVIGAEELVVIGYACPQASLARRTRAKAAPK